VCTEGGVSEDYIRRTHGMISTCVDMHIEDCENVYKETKRLPPIQKVIFFIKKHRFIDLTLGIHSLFLSPDYPRNSEVFKQP